MKTLAATDTAELKTEDRITIVLADDHPLLRLALRDILERETDFAIVGETGDGREAVKLADELAPTVIIMDISMPGMDGLEATRQIKAAHPGIAVLVLTVHTDDQYIVEMLKAGAAGYLLKSIFGEEIVQAIRAVVAGEIVLSPSIGRQLMRQAARYQTKPVPLEAGEKLSAREMEVLKLAAQGMSNKDIADNLGVRERTIKGYLSDIFSKLGVASRTEAVVFGLRAGYLSLDDLK